MKIHPHPQKFPTWLWFFIILALGAVGVLLYRWRRKPGARPRYTEPDSIPLNMSGEYRAAAAWQVGEDIDLQAARMDDESPATANESSDIAAEQRTGRQPSAPRAPETVRIEHIQAAGAAAGAESPEAEAPVKPDDLKLIEGIGPVIAALLVENGITTFRQLADTSPERLSEILTQARLNRLADPATWPEQAHLAAEGQWDAFDRLVASLKRGRRTA